MPHENDAPRSDPRGYLYRLQADGTAVIEGYLGEEAEPVVPAELEGHPVTDIGDSAFASAWSLERVTLPEGLVSLGSAAFSSCSELREVTLPGSLTRLGFNPFGGCESLTDIRVAPGHPVLAVEEGVLFHRGQRRLVCYPGGRPGARYAVPEGTVVIGSRAFDSCDELEEVLLPEGLETLAYAAFRDCGGLAEVNLPRSLRRQPMNPFLCCWSLRTLRLPPDHPCLTVTEGMLINRDSGRLLCRLSACPGTHAEVPPGVTNIGWDAFRDNAGLQTAALPEGVVTLGARAFGECISLTGVTLPESLVVMQSGAFFQCRSLNDVRLPEGLRWIGPGAFAGCASLTRLRLPDSVGFIGKRAFAGCGRLTLAASPGSPGRRFCEENGLRCVSPEDPGAGD